MHLLVLVQFVPVCVTSSELAVRSQMGYRAITESDILNCQEDSRDEQIAFKLHCLKNKQARPSRTAAEQNNP